MEPPLVPGVKDLEHLLRVKPQGPGDHLPATLPHEISEQEISSGRESGTSGAGSKSRQG